MQPGLVVADRFRIEDPIGEGGIGRVYGATDLRSGGRAAIKVLRPEFARDARVRRRFRREARAVGRLVHPHIVRLLAYGEEPSGGSPYLVMELVAGTSLSEMRANGLDLPRLLMVVDQTLSALAFAHARGVVHRDVKPENIIADLSGPVPVAKLLDFGFARVEDDQDPRLTQAHGDAFGTPIYMAPEQASGKDAIGPPTDLYGVGIILYEFLSGRPPFTGAHGMAVALKHLMEEVPPLVARPGLVLPPGLVDVVLRALQKDPRDRYQTAADMRRALSPFIQRDGQWDAELAAVDELPDADRTIAQAVGPLTTGGTPSPYDDTAVGVTVAALQAALTAPDPEGAPARPPAGPEAERVVDEAAGPLVGRDADMVWLWDRVREVVEGGQARIALLGAQVGMGRSRLVRWLRDQMAEGGWMLCVGGSHGPADGAEEGLRGALDELFGYLPADRREAEARMRGLLERWQAYEGGPGATGGDSTRISALISYLRPDEARGEGLGEADQIRGEVLYDRVCDVLRAAACERPVLLLLEALEHVAPESFGFLRFLSRSIRRRPFPILVLLTYETDEAGAPAPDVARSVLPFTAEADPAVVTRVLAPLAPADLLVLLRAVASVDDEVGRAVARRVRGNPLFARELALLLRQTGELVERQGTLVLAPGAEPATWPATMAETVTRRARQTIARLPDAAFLQEVLEHAAVLGRSFDYDLLLGYLTRTMGDERRVEATLEALIQAQVLVENRSPAVDRVELAHAALRDALLAEVSERGQAARLHRFAADALAARRGARGLALSLQIAEHYRLAGLPGEAARFYVEAASHAHREEQFDRTRELLEDADRLLASQTGNGAERQRAMLWLDLGELELQHGNAQRARALAGRVHDWARLEGEPLLEGRALLLLSDMVRAQLRSGGDPAKVAAGYARAREAFERAGNQSGVARCLLGHAMVERGRGQLDAARGLFERARDAMEQAGDAVGTARAWRGLADIALRRGELAEAVRFLEAARSRFAAAGDRGGTTQSHWLLGETCRRLGDGERARANLTAAAAGYAALGDRAGLARCHLALGRLHRAADRRVDAEECLRRAAEGFDDLADEAHAAAARTELAFCAAEQGQLERARQALAEALPAAVQAGDATREALIRAGMAWVAAERGDVAASAAELQAARAFDGQRPLADADFARALEGVADVEVRRGRVAWAQPLYRRAGEIFRLVRAPAAASRVDDKLARLLIP